ncbi:MAG: hypothetical protein ACOYVK_16895 [Bacillota bacterium]
MQLMDLIQQKYHVVSVVGMAKNAGKTMTLNKLIDEAMEKHIRLGLTSTGRDGEKQDLVTMTEKPMIYVEEGTLIATTEGTFKLSEAKLEILEVTDYYTSMGRIVIAKAQSSGYVELAGPNTTRDIKAVTERLLQYGAKVVIVDGAIDRMASAAPSVTEATILATGAVLSRDMNQVIERTIHQVQLFSLEEVKEQEVRLLAESVLENKEYCLIDDDYQVEMIPIQTALNSGQQIGTALKDHTAYVVIGGSLVTKTIKDIMDVTKKYKQVTFIVKDATRIFVDAKDWLYFVKMGLQVKVLHKISPLAVTVNPYAPQGYYFDPMEFRKKMQEYLKHIPVLDVVLGGEA